MAAWPTCTHDPLLLKKLLVPSKWIGWCNVYIIPPSLHLLALNVLLEGRERGIPCKCMKPIKG